MDKKFFGETLEKKEIFESIERERDRLNDLAVQIWENPELGLHEEKSSQKIIDVLEEKGFTIEKNVARMPTAFMASYGKESPKIGVLGEYDALPGLSQKVKAEREPVKEGEPGHGCGHNLLGVGSLGGAIAIKEAIEKGNIEGSIVYYGCPAEEQLVGKVFMAREGVFDKLDAALTWHPWRLNTPWMSNWLALNNVKFNFKGEEAHAAAAPEAGRSALDAVELTNIGTEYMREHISDEAKVHYCISDGGKSPNVVTPEATVWYYVRAPERKEVERITDWVRDIAKGAAKMTQTEVEEEFLTGTYGVNPNETISGIIHENMKEVGPIKYTDEEKEFAKKLRERIGEEKVKAQMAKAPEKVLEHNLYSEPLKAFDKGSVFPASTDVGDVSWLTPLAQFKGAAWAIGTPPHSWQAVAASGSFGKKAMIFAAKIIAGTAYDLMTDMSKLNKAKKEFEKATKEKKYESPLPEEAEPPFEITEEE